MVVAASDVLDELPIRRRRARRTGSITPALIFALAALLAIFALPVNSSLLWEYRSQLQVAGDAASLAGAELLVDDDQLRSNPLLEGPLMERVRAEAAKFAALNIVRGQPFQLLPNDLNDPNGDVVIGSIDKFGVKEIILAQDAAGRAALPVPQLTAVRVHPRLTRERGNAPTLIFGQFTGAANAEVRAASTTMLDRDVIGFRPVVSAPIPLAPLAFLSDVTAANTESWQYQVETTNGPDALTYTKATNTFTAGADGIREFEAKVALSVVGTGNTAMLTIDTANATALANQLLTGVTPANFTPFGGQIVLGANNQLTLAGTTVGDQATLQAALQQLQLSGAVRIFPLYCATDSGAGTVTICGFVAGRVAAVTPPPMVGDPLRFTVQATMVSNAAAVTDASRRGVGGVPIVNPYVSKVRIVE